MLQKCVLGVFLHPAVVAQLHLPSVHESAAALFACCGQGLVIVLLVGQFRAALDLGWVRTGVCQSCSSSRLQGTLPMLSPQKLLLVGRASSEPRYLPPARCWGHSLATVVIFPSSQGMSYL